MMTSRVRKPSSAASSHAPDQKLIISVPLSRRVVAKALAEGSGGVARERWVGVRLDLELERRAGRRELEQLVEQQRALVARSAVAVAEPARADLRRGALVGPAGQRGADFEQRVVQQHELAVGGQAAVRLETVEWPLRARRRAPRPKSPARRPGQAGGHKAPGAHAATVAVSARSPVTRL